MATTSFDAESIGQILRTGRVSRTLLRESAQACGEECPACGGRETESNGHTEHRCVACDHRWGYDNGERYGF